MMKKIIIIACSIAVLIVGGFLLWNFVFSPSGIAPTGGSENIVPVTSVAEITGIGGGVSTQTKFSGVVEPQESIGVKKDPEKVVAVTNVSVGDKVKAGDVLFSYDTESLGITVEEKRLQVETFSNTINVMNQQIADLEKQRASASQSEKLEYTLQIQSIQLDIRSEQYNQTIAAKELTELEASLKNTDVVSPIDGIVKAVATDGAVDQNGQPSNDYITILSVGDYRVKATVSELNQNSLYPGMPIILRSRIDDTQTWNGSIDYIDYENPVQNNNSNYYPVAEDGSQSATKYYFYIKLDSFDGLILGQHLFVETDYGQNEEKDGLWLPSYFIVSEESGTSFVWAQRDNNTLEKRGVTLGEYDGELDTYQIVDGVTAQDYLAFPEERLVEGLPTIDQAQYIPEPMPEGEIMPEEGYIEGEVMPEEGYIEGEVMPEEGYIEGEVMPEEGYIEGEVMPEEGYIEGEAMPEEGYTEGEAAPEEPAVDEAQGVG